MTEVAKAYGGALYELSLEEGVAEDTLSELIALKKAFSENEEFLKLLSSPVLKKAERIKIVDDSFGGKISKNVVNFLKILIERKYVKEFFDCVKEFNKRYNKDNNIEEATVITAVPLSDELALKLQKKLEEITGKSIIMDCKVDPKVIGGVRLIMDGEEFEGSVKQRLDTLRKNLTEITA